MPAGYLCGACRRRPPAFERLRAAWLYQPPLDAVVRGFKFERLQYLGRRLAEGMAQRLAGEVQGCDCVVAVPLHWRRRWSRGFDQARAIAEPLAAVLQLPLSAALVRSRATPPQSSLERSARLANPRGAFEVRPSRLWRPVVVADRQIVLVDDVVTTGATLAAAAQVLLRAGARRVVAIAAARTPAFDEATHSAAGESGGEFQGRRGERSPGEVP